MFAFDFVEKGAGVLPLYYLQMQNVVRDGLFVNFLSCLVKSFDKPEHCTYSKSNTENTIPSGH